MDPIEPIEGDNVVQFLPRDPYSTESAKRFKREKFDDIEPASTEWLVKHFLPALGIAIVYGISTVGKSFLLLYIALRICAGKTVLGHKTRRSGVLYIAAEGQNGMRKRIKALREKFGIRAAAFQLIGDGINLLDEAHVNGLCIEAREARDEMLAEAGLELGLIIIDTTSASMPGGNENSGEDMSLVLAAGQKIGQAAGALVLFIAHPGKDEGRGVRGWSGQTGNIDAQIYLSPSEDDKDLAIGVVQKLKDGEDGERFAYRLQEIGMGYDAEGDRITSAYPVFEDPPMLEGKGKKAASRLSPGGTLLMRGLRLLVEEGQCSPAPRVPGVKVGTMAVKRVALRERVITMGWAEDDDKPDTVKRNINREITKLIAAMEVRAEGDWLWVAK